MPYFADILLPLPLPGTFTYSLSDSQAETAVVGARTVVQFGRQHYYTGLIVNLHRLQPDGYEIKPVIQLLDEASIIRHPQMQLWQWISQYYLCSLGEVMKAALPAGLKLESETKVSANPEYEETDSERLSAGELEILSLMGKQPVSTGALEKLSGRKNLLPVIRKLLDKEAVYVHEEIQHHYRPKMQEYVRLTLADKSEATLAPVFAALKRSQKQQALFMKLLDMSRFLQKEEPEAVAKLPLLQQAGCTPAILHDLRKKGLVEIHTLPVDRDFRNEERTLQPPHPLSPIQQRAYNEVLHSFGSHNITLLHGVTSSGKTEIYIHLIRKAIGEKKQVLFLVPEIALTTQLCLRLRKVFGRKMIVYHSKLSDNERVELWHRLLKDENCGNMPSALHQEETGSIQPPEGIDLVLGVRSAVLLPFRQLGMVIVDEEHEPSFKQQDPAPRYHGRDVAIMLAQRHNAKVLLGSATPSIESYHLARQGRYGLVTLSERHAGLTLPKITLVSILEARKEKTLCGPFTPSLIQHVNHTLQEGYQAILFQNRRGFAPVVECTSCSWVPRCPRCDVSLTYHKKNRNLTCHYCGYAQPLPDRCPICGNHTLEQLGYGTERIEESISHILPQARPLRMDTDTTGSRKSYERLIRQFEEKRCNILIGTQMISKGLDFNGVKTVGILNADTMMNYPDFRAHERAFQLMEQVSGRAGRHDTEGEVLIQCSDPRHPLLQQVIRHDYTGMVETQLEDRRRFGYPPYTRLIAIYLKGRYENRLQQLASDYAVRLRECFGSRVLGPDSPIVGRVKNFHIRKILLKIEREASTAEVRKVLARVQEQMQQHKDFSRLVLYYDVDPV